MDTTIFSDGRQCVQIALLMVKIVYTATHSAALVYVRCNEKKVKDLYINKNNSDEDKEDNKEKNNKKNNKNNNWNKEYNKILYYKNIILLLLSNPDGIRDVLAIKVNIKYTKRHHKKSKRYINFLFY